MIYPGNFEEKTGFDGIRRQLSSLCQSGMGAACVESMEFLTDFRKIATLLRQTAEMKSLFESGADFPETSFNQLALWLPAKQVEGSYAGPEEFDELRKSLRSFESVRLFFTRREGDGDDEQNTYRFPVLSQLFIQLEAFPDIVKAIDRILDKDGLVKDSASPALADVRQRLSSMQGSIACAIQRVFSSAVREGIADGDSAPTFRNGRMVIPVPAVNKRRLSGIIHDESTSGKTVFIEPAETVELSNRIRELEIEEQRIIVKLLIELTDVVRPYIDSILANNLLLGQLDFIMAKARFAIAVGGDLPSLEARPEIDWYGAVHPVLLQNLRQQKREIVPLNIRLDGRRRMLLISGPNAGGKSVALKTVAVVQYMCQCGILPTLYSNSHMGIFNKIFMDIGDEQSIENDLSTYSSHLKNMRFFLLHADKRSLVLIDEIGSGTEPSIGSALAKSILVELAASRCYGIVTTHYHNLKRFAEETESFVNGAMLYDRQKLQPTFQLSIGNAGSSFALEIAQKIGLPRKVIDMAKEEVGEEYVESDRFLMEIARDRKYWQSKRQNIKEREARLESLEQKYENLIADLNRQRRQIIEEAKDEARSLLSDTNRKIENTISDIRSAQAEKERTKELRKELDDFKQEVQNYPEDIVEDKLRRKLPPKKQRQKAKGEGKVQKPAPAPSAPKKELEIGDYVKMQGSMQTGRIISISGKEAEVAFGQLRTKVKIDRLQAAAAPAPQLTSGYSLLNAGSSDASRRRQLEFKDELDIRGARADEALDRTIRFIDDAIQFGIKKVRILHGTGGGILRQIVRQQLASTPGVASYQDEDVRLGGAGITVVNLY